MGAHVVVKDLYSKDGILLLAQGQELTEEQVKRLEQLGYKDSLKEIIAHDSEEENEGLAEDIPILNLNSLNLINDRVPNKQVERYNSKINKLQKNLEIKDLELFNSASEMLQNIIFYSKDKPWWVYINTLSNYLDCLYTHSIDVALISAMLATYFKINNVKDIALGALLHDIGKLLVPKDLIQKPHSLTAEEQIYIQQHCELGKSMLIEVNLNPIIYNIIFQHHEKLDGSGYPNALAGSQIPLYSQIVMVADTFDRMTSYWSINNPKTVLDEMRRADEKYPKDVVEALNVLIS